MKTIAPLLLVLMIQSIAPAQSFKVMTYNILAEGLEGPGQHWLDPNDPRRDRVGAILQQEDADLIGFQEVTDSQLPDLIEFLPEYDYILGTPAFFYNAIFFKRDRYLVLDNGIIDLPDPRNPFDLIRNVLWAQMFDWETNQSFVMADTHFSYPAFNAIVSQQEVPAITNGLPLLFVGDLNFPPSSEGFSTITGQSGPQNFTLNDACDPFCGDVSSVPGWPPGTRIDHVLHTSEIVATDARVVTDLVDGLLPSDHFAVTADLLNTSPPTARPTHLQYTLISGDIDDQIVWERGSSSGFDGLGDGIGAIGVGAFLASGEASFNILSRQVMKFQLPFTTVTETTVENATLRVFVEDLLGTLPEGLSLMHDVDDNDSEVLKSHYEAPYVDTGLELFVPQDGAGQYYDIDVTEFVRADYQSDGSDPWSAFRLQLTDGEQFAGQTAAYIIGGSQLEITLGIVPEPSDLIMLLTSGVADLVEDGVLNQSQGNSLLMKLNFNSNQQATLNRIGALINQVNAFVNAGLLSFEEGQSLIDTAESLHDILSVEGDFNVDGDMDGSDFLKWQRGGSPNPLSASDLADWEANYGMDASLLAISAATVPEPSSLLLGAMASIGLMLRRRCLTR